MKGNKDVKLEKRFAQEMAFAATLHDQKYVMEPFIDCNIFL